MTTENNDIQLDHAPPAVLYTSLAQHAPSRELIEAAAVLLVKAEKFNAVPTSDADAALMGEFRARLNDTKTKKDKERLAATKPHRDLVAKLNKECNDQIDLMDVVLTRTDEFLAAFRKQQADAHAKALKEKADEEARVAREKADAEAKAREANEAAQKAADDAEAARVALTTAATPEAQAEAQKKLDEAQATQEASISVAAQQAATAVQLEQRQEVLTSMPAPLAPGRSIRGSYGSTSTQKDNWKYRLIDTEEQPAAVSIKLVPEEYLVEPVDRLNKSVLNAKARSVKKATTTLIPGIEIYNEPGESSRVGR